ncbi:ATP-binding protein [Streptomyces sp. NPDC047999]|uniref:ATP-binding protein n=1 Tax=Streptomyces sp. NPDC047999 TaxID=3365497 RepID=UPI00371B37F7
MRHLPGPDTPFDRSPAGDQGLLPVELNRFVGRETELAEIGRALAGSRLVTVVGTGGIGKTRLALRAADGLKNGYADGVRLVALAPLRDPRLVVHALLEALHVTDHTSRPAREVLLERVRGLSALLVVDGFEHLVDGCAALVREVLCRAPGVAVLAVGRRPLRVDGEVVLPVGPLAGADAAVLFADRAAEVLPRWRPDAADRERVRELCRRLDGIPLALELAAARLPAIGLEELLHRLGDRFALLTSGARGVLPRHGTLRTAIGWSHELCTPAERLLWARLSVFAGPFDLEAAEYVCSGPELPESSVVDVLGGLVAQSVVHREETPAGRRYGMLDTLRAYGAGWLAALGDEERLRSRHRDWHLGLATWCELEWFSPRQAEVAAVADSSLPDLRAAMEWCLERPEEAHLGQFLAGTLWFSWVGCGRLAEGRYWLDRALGRAPGGARPYEDARLKALWVLGYVAVLQGDPAAAAAALHACEEGARAAGNAVAGAYAVHRRGCLALLSDEPAEAERLLRAALDAYDRAGELNSNVLMGRVELALALAFQGRPGDAVALCEQVREVCESFGEEWARAYALYVLAHAAWTAGDHPRARVLLSRCVAVDHRFHDLVGLVLALELLALVTASEGDAVEAAVLMGATAPVWESVGLARFGSRCFAVPRAQCEERTRAALGAARYEECAAAGRALSLDAVVERALAACDRAPRRSRRAGGTRKPASLPTGRGGEAAG